MSNTSLLGSYGAQDSSSLMFRNRIINGGMEIWQRGDNTTGSGFFADRWLITAGVTTAVENGTGSPTGFRRNALISRNVSGTMVVAQRIEARNCYDLAGQAVTVTFHHTSNAGQIDSVKVGLRYANTEDTFSGTTLIQEVTLSSSATGWKTVTFNALPSQAANGLQLEFSYAVTGSSSVRLTGVQLEAGPTATPFERRPYGTELALCQRYFQKITSYVYGSSTTKEAIISYPVYFRSSVALSNITFGANGGSTPVYAYATSSTGSCYMSATGGAPAALHGCFFEASSEL